MSLDIEPHLARILEMKRPQPLFLMEIPVSLDPAAISLSLLPLLLTLGADPITKHKGFIGKVCIKNVIIISIHTCIMYC